MPKTGRNPQTASSGVQRQIRDQNQQRILKAAEIEFVKHGFKGTTMQTIADRAELPKANVHYYFKSKKNLYKQLLTHIINHWNSGLADITPESDPETALRQFIREKIKQTFANKNHAKLFALEVVQGAPHFGDFISTEMKQWVDEKTAIIQTWIDADKIKVKDPLQLLVWIWATTQRYAEFEMEILTLQGKKDYSKKDIESISQELEEFILRGCGLSA